MTASERTHSEGSVATAACDVSEDYAGLLIDRLAATIIDDSLPLKEVERDLRGSVAQVAIKKRGLDKRETANRCGVTEKSIENYLKESRNNPKSPEREVARALQDEMLSLEEIYNSVSPILSPTRNFTLDDAKRAVEKLIRTGEVQEYPGHKYRAVERPAIRHPATVESHRDLVDQKARDLDYIVLRQKEATEDDVQRRTQRYSRVVGDSNLVRIDFTVDVAEENLGEFYEKLSGAIAKLTMKEEKKKGKSRVRLLLGMRSVTSMLVVALVAFSLCVLGTKSSVVDSLVGSIADGLLPVAEAADGNGDGENGRSWELDKDPKPQDEDEDNPAAADEDEPEVVGGGGSLDDEDDPGVGVADEDEEDEYLPPRAEPGDVNMDDDVNIGDVVNLLMFLQFGGHSPACPGAADIDGDGFLDMRDPLVLLQVLYLGGADRPWLGDVDADRRNSPVEQRDEDAPDGDAGADADAPKLLEDGANVEHDGRVECGEEIAL